MLNDETLKALIEAIIYVAPEPVSLGAILKTLEGEECERVQLKLEELIADFQQGLHGIQVRQVAAGYKFYSKPEHHEVLRKFVKSLKPPMRLSKPALEALAVIAYRQPVTLPEMEEIRGVDCGGVIHTLMEKKLIVTSGRKNVVGRPILYRTSREFLVHFGLKDVNELPSLKEFEELAKRALGSEWTTAESGPSSEETPAASQPSPQSEPATAESKIEETSPSAQETSQSAPNDSPVAVEIAAPAGEAGLETSQNSNFSMAEETPPAAASESPVTGGTGTSHSLGSLETVQNSNSEMAEETRPTAASESPVTGESEADHNPERPETAQSSDFEMVEEALPAASLEPDQAGTPPALPHEKEQE